MKKEIINKVTTDEIDKAIKKLIKDYGCVLVSLGADNCVLVSLGADNDEIIKMCAKTNHKVYHNLKV